MKRFDWNAFWLIVDLTWTLVCYGLITVAVYNKDWMQATFWMSWLILDRVRKGQS